MVGLGRVGGSSGVGEDRAEEEPGAEVAADEVGVLALPAEPGGLGERLLHHRRGVDEHLHVARRPAPRSARRCRFSAPLMRSW